MKKIIIISFLIAVSIFSINTAILADDAAATTTQPSAELIQDETVTAADLGIKEPTILPDSWMYFIQEWKRSLKQAITFNPVKRAELQLRIASERLLEAKKLSEKTNNQQILDKATKKYNETVDKIKAATDKIKGNVDSNSAIGKFLDKYTQQQILHEKILDKLAGKVATSTLEKIREARDRHLEKFGEVMQKLENKDKIKERLEKNFTEIKGSIFKEIKDIEILQKIASSSPENIKEKINEAKDDIAEKFQEKLQKMAPQNQDALERYINNSQKMISHKLEILETIQTRLASTSSAIQKLEQIQEQLREKERIQQNLIGGDKDEYGCLIAAGYTWCQAKQKCLRTWEEKCDQTATSTKANDCVCTMVYSPVCGKNGITYGNACMAKCQKIEIEKQGTCKGNVSSTTPNVGTMNIEIEAEPIR